MWRRNNEHVISHCQKYKTHREKQFKQFKSWVFKRNWVAEQKIYTVNDCHPAMKQKEEEEEEEEECLWSSFPKKN